MENGNWAVPEFLTSQFANSRLAPQVRRPVVPPSTIVRDSKRVVSCIHCGFGMSSEYGNQKWVIYDGEGGRMSNEEDLDGQGDFTEQTLRRRRVRV